MVRYKEAIIDFFKNHNLYDEEMFNYLQMQTDMIDFRMEDLRVCIGCGYDTKNRKLRLALPYPDDYQTTLMNIFYITEAIVAYKHFGKNFEPGVARRALPMLYEKMFVLENPTEDLVKHSEYLDSAIDESSSEDYKFGLSVRDELLKEYDGNYKKMENLTKKMTRVYRRQNRNK